MYKSRITKWKLDKNHKQDEMRAMAIEAHKCMQESRQFVSCVRGKAVTYEDIVHYFKRRGQDINDVITDCSFGSTPFMAQYVTPKLSAACLPPTIAYTVPEQVAQSVHSYIHGYFHNIKLSTSGTEFKSTCRFAIFKGQRLIDMIGRMSLFHNRVLHGCHLISIGDRIKGSRKLNAGMRLIENIVQSGYPSLLAVLPHLLLAVMKYTPKVKIAPCILENFARLAKHYHGSGHPLYGLCRVLSSLDDQEKLHLGLDATIFAIHEAFSVTLIPAHRIFLTAQRNFVSPILERRCRGTDADGYRAFLRMHSGQLSGGYPCVVTCLYELALMLQYRGQLPEDKDPDEKLLDDVWRKLMMRRRE